MATGLIAVALIVAVVRGPAQAATIDILWYSGGVVNFGRAYQASFDALADKTGCWR